MSHTPDRIQPRPQIPTQSWWGPMGARFFEIAVVGGQPSPRQPHSTDIRMGVFANKTSSYETHGFMQKDERVAFTGQYADLRDVLPDADTVTASGPIQEAFVDDKRMQSMQKLGGVAAYKLTRGAHQGNFRFGLVVPEMLLTVAYDALSETEMAGEERISHRAVLHILLNRLPDTAILAEDLRVDAPIATAGDASRPRVRQSRLVALPGSAHASTARANLRAVAHPQPDHIA